MPVTSASLVQRFAGRSAASEADLEASLAFVVRAQAPVAHLRVAEAVACVASALVSTSCVVPLRLA